MLASPVSRPSDEGAGPLAHTEVATLFLTVIQLQSAAANEGLDDAQDQQNGAHDKGRTRHGAENRLTRFPGTVVIEQKRPAIS